MALFPPEFIAGLLAAFLQFRLRAYFSIASLFVSGLSFFLPPDDELIATLNGSTGNSKSKAQQPLSPDDKMQAFYVKVAKTEHGVFQQTLFYELYEMLVIIATSTLTACAVSDMVAFAKPWLAMPAANTTTAASEVSAYGLVSTLLVALWFPLQIKFAQGLATYEARLGVGVGVLGAVLAGFALFAPANLLDFDVEVAADVIGARLALVLRAIGFVDQDLDALAPIAQTGRLSLFVSLAVVAGVFTCTSFLPAFRFARMYSEMTADAATSRLSKLLLHLNMLAPLLVAVLWIKPLAHDAIVPSYLVECAPKALRRDCFATAADAAMFANSATVLTETHFAQLRIAIVLTTIIVRLLCFRRHLQFFLLEIRDAMVQIVRRVGRVDGALLQSKVRIQFNYLPIIAVQYLAPAIATLSAAVLLMRQTGVTLGAADALRAVLLHGIGVASPAALADHIGGLQRPDATPPDFGSWRLGHDFAHDEVAHFVRGMAHFTIVTPECYAAVLGFLLWWLNVTWFAVSAAGLVYWKNVPHFTPSGVPDDAAGTDARRNKQTPKMLKNQLKSLKVKKH